MSPRRGRSFDGYLQLFHWTELIQSSPLAVERSVYEVIGGAYRKNNITTIELRFNPMKRNRGGEQDLDHIISAAIRGMDRASLEYPSTPGLIFCLDRAFPYTSTRSSPRRRSPTTSGASSASTSPARSRRTSSRPTTRALPALPAPGPRHHGPHRGVGPVEEIAEVIEQLEPSRIGHGVKSAYDSARWP